MRVAQTLNTASGWYLQKRMLSGCKCTIRVSTYEGPRTFFGKLKHLEEKSKVGDSKQESYF